VLSGDERCDLLAVRVDQLAEAEHDLGAPGQAGGPPRRLGGLGHGDRGVHLGRRCEVDGGLLLAGGRVPDDALTT